jgi:predicted ribosomally synthesized peptide with nif11-like leader
MPKSEALRFLQQMETDVDLFEKVRAALLTDDAGQASFSTVAGEHGFTFNMDELREAHEELHNQELEQLDALEVSDEEIEQVAGGRGVNYACSYTYMDDENCFHDDQCNMAYHYYKMIELCDYTYNPRESCFSLDRSLGGYKF